MSKVFLTMAMSLDGFITGPNDDAQNPAGIDGMRLIDWLDDVEKDGNSPQGYRPSDPSSPSSTWSAPSRHRARCTSATRYGTRKASA